MKKQKEFLKLDDKNFENVSDLSEDSFNKVDDSEFEFESASKFFQSKSPNCSSFRKSNKRAMSDEESENRRTRSKSNSFRNSSVKENIIKQSV